MEAPLSLRMFQKYDKCMKAILFVCLFVCLFFRSFVILLSQMIVARTHADDSGTISEKEFRSLCDAVGHHLSDAELKAAMKIADKDGHGVVTYPGLLFLVSVCCRSIYLFSS